MERNQVIGLFLIGAILIGWQFMNGPSAEDIQAEKEKQDSIQKVELALKEKALQAEAEAKEAQAKQDAYLLSMSDSAKAVYDSIQGAELANQYGDFAEAADKKEKTTSLETDLLKVDIINKGGQLSAVQLKEFTTHDSLPLYLFKGDSSHYNFSFVYQNRTLSTSDLYFEPSVSQDGDKQIVSMKAYAGASNKYIEFSYGFPKDNYMIDFNVNIVGMPELLAGNSNKLKMDWTLTPLAKEKGRQLENQGTSIFYKYFDDNVDYLSETSDDDKILEENTHWVSFKQQFFSVVLVAPKGMVANESNLKVKPLSELSEYTKEMDAQLSLNTESNSIPMQIYLGPNNYNILDTYDIDLEDQINLGWGIFRWISKGLIIPLFDILSGWGLPVIVIIVILTFFIKALLFPITYKTYLSSAKMKALKPEIDEINEKFKDKEGADMKKQQEVMALYKETGVNPFAGCIPMLIQFPVLIAMYRFFPSSIELRQQGFLWAEDLSTYDAIYSWATEIPFLSSFYGNHISGFTLLMAISMIFYTRNNTSMNTMSGPQAQQMKIMTYMMPVMMIFWFNKFSAGLSIYYFIANMTTMGQQWVIKKFILDEEKIHKQIQENKKKPKKKSRIEKAMEKMNQQQQAQQNNRKQRRTK